MDTSFNVSDIARTSWAMTPELQDIVDADPGMIAELLTLFLDDSASRLKSLSSACARDDFKVICTEAHSLKGSALQMGASGLASLCAALEKSERPGINQREAMTREIDVEFTLVRREIEQYRAATGTAGILPEKGQQTMVAG